MWLSMCLAGTTRPRPARVQAVREESMPEAESPINQVPSCFSVLRVVYRTCIHMKLRLCCFVGSAVLVLMQLAASQLRQLLSYCKCYCISVNVAAAL